MNGHFKSLSVIDTKHIMITVIYHICHCHYYPCIKECVIKSVALLNCGTKCQEVVVNEHLCTSQITCLEVFVASMMTPADNLHHAALGWQGWGCRSRSTRTISIV